MTSFYQNVFSQLMPCGGAWLMDQCYGAVSVSLQSSYIETLTSNMMVLGIEALGELIRFK